MSALEPYLDCILQRAQFGVLLLRSRDAGALRRALPVIPRRGVDRRPVATPTFGVAVARIPDSDRHRAEAVEEARFGMNRPPVVQEDFERPPHCDPSADDEALAQQVADTAVLHERTDEPAHGKSGYQECNAHRQTYASKAKQLSQTLPCRGGSTS